jgi:MarR family transcriptional regulator, organic hydroperoxide resistance regulator
VVSKGTDFKLMTGADPGDQAHELLVGLRAIQRRLRVDVSADIVRSGLTAPQIALLSSLVRGGATSLTELSRELGLSHSTASGIVDRLEMRGLVRREPDEADRRRTRISLTDQVRDYVQVLRRGPASSLAEALEKAGPADREAITRGIGLLRQILEGD